jgi:hypothetical protein
LFKLLEWKSFQCQSRDECGELPENLMLLADFLEYVKAEHGLAFIKRTPGKLVELEPEQIPVKIPVSKERAQELVSGESSFVEHCSK